MLPTWALRHSSMPNSASSSLSENSKQRVVNGEMGVSTQALPPLQAKSAATVSPSASTALSLRSAPFRTTRSWSDVDVIVRARCCLSCWTVAEGVAKSTCTELKVRRTLMRETGEAEVIFGRHLPTLEAITLKKLARHLCPRIRGQPRIFRPQCHGLTHKPATPSLGRNESVARVRQTDLRGQV